MRRGSHWWSVKLTPANRPQTYASPVSEHATVEYGPHETFVMKAPSSRVTSAGRSCFCCTALLSSGAERPTSPKMFEPHVYTCPVAVHATVCEKPHATCTTPSSATRRGKNDMAFGEPVPS